MKFNICTYAFIFSLLNLFFTGCSEDTTPYPEKEIYFEVEYPANALLIEEYASMHNETSPAWLVKTYEYDEYKRLIKTYVPMQSENGEISGIYGYTLYKYDTNGLLIKEEEYACTNPSDSVLTLNAIYDYIYLSGKLQTKRCTNYSGGPHSHIQYTYEKDLLVKEEQYFENKLTFYMTYEYDSNKKLISIKTYNPVNNNAFFAWCSYSEYEYENSLIASKKNYNVFNEATLSATSTEMYYYDSNANLILIKTNVHTPKDNHFPMPTVIPNKRWFVYEQTEIS